MTLKASKFLSLSSAERRLALEAFIFQLAAGFLLKVIPFRNIPRFFRNPDTDSNRKSCSKGQKDITPEGHTSSNQEEGSGEHKELLSSIRTAIGRSASYVFWRNRCLVQSLAARWMLKKRGITSQLYLGLSKDVNKNTIAHAWIKVGENEIVSKNGDFIELFAF